MRRIILVILTALAATFPPSLLLSFVSPSSPLGCATALPHPSITRSTAVGLTIAAFKLANPAHHVSSIEIQIGGGLSALAKSREFLTPSSGDAINVNTLPEGHKNLDTFKLAVLGAKKGMGSDCAYSMVEFQNNHPTEDIIIYSAHIEPSVVFPLEVADSIAPNPLESSPPPLFPQEYYLSEYHEMIHNQKQRDRELHIHPGNTVTLPVSILPHYKRYDGPRITKPTRHPDFPRDSSDADMESIMASGTIDPPSTPDSSQERLWHDLSLTSSLNYINQQSFIRLDLYQMGQSVLQTLKHPPSSSFQTILPQGEIHETLFANTSWGFLRMKVPYTCSVDSREYEYGLPNNLMFMDGGGGWYSRTNNTRPSSNQEENPFLYDLYMDNPSPDALRVLDIFATRPELIVVRDANSKAKDSLYNPLVPVSISPGKSNEYVATIQLLPDQLNFTDISSLTDLGYLELRTTAGAFSIGLDFIPNRNRWGVIHGIEQNHSTVGNLELTKKYKLSKLSAFLTVSEDDPYYSNHASTINLYRKSDSDQTGPTRQFFEQLSKQKWVTDLSSGSFTENDTFLVAQPSSINFGVITSGSRAIRIPVNLANMSPFALTVMRISVSMRMITDEGFVPLELDHHVLKVGIEFSGGNMIPLHQNGSSYEFPHTMMVLPATAYHYPMSVWCRFIVSPGHAVTPRKYSGSIVIRSKAGKLPTNMPYDDWTQESLLDNPISHRFVTAVPFEVSIIPGNFRISTDTLLFPSHYTMLPPEELHELKRRNKKKAPDYVDRFLVVTNNFMVPITITSMQISNSPEYSLCNSIFSIVPPSDENTWQTAQSNQTWKIPIRFTFNSYLKYVKDPRKCILSLETDLVGMQSLPLIIHSGQLLVEVQNGDLGMQNNECVIATNETLSRDKGLACLYNWIETKHDGQFFSSVMKELKKQSIFDSCRESPKKTNSPVAEYFASLLSHNPHRMEPVLLKLGAVSSGRIVKRSILFTNLNPSPIEVTASSSVFDYMNVTIGHKATSIPDALERMPGRDGHIKSFLSHATIARSFLSKLNSKVDISLSPRATSGDLQSLYGSQAVEYTFQDSSDYQASEIYRTKSEEMTCAAGLIVSTDGKYRKSFTSRGVSSKKWKIPPGGVARFEVTLRTPDQTELKSDMSSFIATGLALETNFGQAFPIILSYSVLLGHLQLVPSLSARGTNETGQNAPDSQPSMQIPMAIRDASTDSHSGGLPVSIQSTFSKQVFLGEVKSCNKWFDFSRKSKESAHSNSDGTSLPNYLPVKARNNSLVDSPAVISVGEVYSTMSCFDETGTGSFFSCALKWLNHRASIKPDGCGLADQELFISNSKTSMNQLKTDATEALVHAVGYFTRPNAGGYVLPRDLMIFKKAREAWDALSFHGLNVVTGHLYAFSAYHDWEPNAVKKESDKTGANSTGSSSSIIAEIMNNHSNLISVPVSTILLKSRLDPPQLVDDSSAILEFDPVHVAQTTECYIPVSNPSGVSVRVQLSAAAASTSDLDGDLFVGMKVFMQTSVTDRHPWWTGEHYWMSGKDGRIIGAPHNVTFTSGSGSSVNLVQPSLQSISSFLYGCGTRCGKRSDAENTGDDVLYTTIGAGSGSGSTLLGYPWHVNGKLPQPPAKFNTIETQPFAVGHSALQEVILPPYGKAELGPVLFRPTKRGDFNTSIFISNNLTGFEEVKLRGRGAWEKLAFLDNDDGSNGGDIEFRNGRSALIFSGSSTAVGQPVVKSFVLANIGDVAVNISGVSMKSSEMKHFSHRRAHPTSTHHSNWFWSLFQQTKPLNSEDKCSNAGFRLVGCKEVKRSPNWIQLLFTSLSAMSSFPVQFAPEPGNASTNFTSFQESFILQPNENKTFFVEHRPDCVLRASYVSVVFDISERDVILNSDQWHKTFRSDKLELLVGYSMNPYAYCLPYMPPASKVMEKLISYAVSSRICQTLFPGLVRRKDEQGNQYVRYEVQINYVAALFFALIMLLLFDLYTSVDFTYGNDDQGPSWKQTRRCLARADPVSADLVALGKEQTKHVLLSRFRKEKVMPTNCVLSDGSFCRDKPGDNAAPGSAPYRRIPSSSQQARTFSDSVFHRQNLLANESKYDDSDEAGSNSGLLPCGLSWRTAARRGISVSRSGSTSALAEPQHLARTRSVLLKKKPLQPKDSSNGDEVCYSAPLQVPVQVSATESNSEHYAPTSIDIKPPQDQPVSTNASDVVPASIKKELNSNPSAGPNDVRQIESKVTPKGTTNKAIPVKTSHGTKDPTSLITKPTPQADQKLTRNDSFKDRQKAKPTSLPKHAINERQSGIEKINSTEKPSKKSSKKVIGDGPVKSPSNGKDQSSLPRPSPPGKSQSSTPIVAKQPFKSQKAKDVSNCEDPAKDKKKEPRKKRNDAPQAKDSSTSKTNSKAALPKRSTSEESVPNSTPVSSAQPSPHSEASLNTPKLMATAGTLRPPPGLLPPPGFADPPPPGFPVPPISSERISPTQHAGEETPTLLSPQPSFSELSPSKTPSILSELQSSTSPPFRTHHDSIPSPSLSGLLSPHLEDGDPGLSPNKEFVNSSMLITDLLPLPPRLTPPLLESNQSDVADSADGADVYDLLGSSNSNFNVMSFLDGIMNDAAKPSQLEESVQNAAGAANPVSLDPWNSLPDKPARSNPLAAIIGRISDVEATTLRGQDDQHEIAGIPLTSNAPSLLTPSALQNNNYGMEPIYASLATEVEDEDDLLEPDSFYSQLLGGD